MATPGVIRRLWRFERDQVRDHLLRLDPDDRLLRFGGYASNAHIAAYGERLDWRRDLVLGYVCGGIVRGLAELKPIGASRPRSAELAVSVERPFQNRGIGTALLRRLMIAARNRLIEQLYMICLMDNGRAVRLARRLDGALQFDHGEVQARIEPPWPTPWTWLEEALLETAVPSGTKGRTDRLRVETTPPPGPDARLSA
jgi:ribosomal protein S18 acetylase RimI-like enzyme